MEEAIDAIVSEFSSSPYDVIVDEIQEDKKQAIIVIKRIGAFHTPTKDNVNKKKSKDERKEQNCCTECLGDLFCEPVFTVFAPIIFAGSALWLCCYCFLKEKYKIKLQQANNIDDKNKIEVDFYINAPKKDIAAEMPLNGWGLTTPCRYKKLYARVCKAVDNSTAMTAMKEESFSALKTDVNKESIPNTNESHEC